MENKNIEAGESLEVRLGQLLLRKGLTMGTAESCTGGKIASLMTSVAGSSAYFVGSVVSYTNEVKHQVLGVSSEALDRYGAVSQSVVEQMAQGATRVLGCDCAVATSGIAGPGGGTPAKPVGTVWIAACHGERVRSACFHFGGDRLGNIRSSAEAALSMLLELLGND